MQHIIRLEDGNSRNLYAYIGPFSSFEAAGQWLDNNGFENVRPNLWERDTPATFKYIANPSDIETKGLRALVESLQTIEELNFKSVAD